MRVPEPIAAAFKAALPPYLASRIILGATAAVANRLIPYGPVSDPWHGTPFQGFLGWDTVHYLGIARHGYPTVALSHTGNNGYFPLLPLLLRVAGSSDAAAVVLGFLLGLAGLMALAAFTTAIWDGAATHQTVWAASFWPSAFYWSAAYTEGLFLLLTVAALWAAMRGRAPAAGGLALLAALTRPTGFALALPLLVLLPAGRGRLWAAVPLLGPLLVAAYLWAHTGTPTALPQAFFGHGSLAPGRPWDAFRTAETWARYGDWQQVAEIPVVVVCVGLLVGVARLPRWRGPALATTVALLAPPVLAGTISSFARYAMVAFPLYWPLRRLALPLLLAVEVPVAVAWTVFASTGHLTP